MSSIEWAARASGLCLSLKSNWNSGPEARRMPRLPPSSLPVRRILFKLPTRAFLHARRRVAEFRGRRDVLNGRNPLRGRKRFRLGSLPESHRRNEILDESYELFYVFLYRYSFQFTERRSRGLINQDKKERKKRFEELV